MLPQDIAVAHWGEYINGGGERVAWELQDALEALLYVSHRDPGIEPETADVRELDVCRAWKAMLDAGDPWRTAAHQLIWQAPPELLEQDVVVTSGNEPLAYVPPDDQTWVAYMHHTSRFATDLYGESLQESEGRLAPLRRLAKTAFRWTERQAYSRYAQKPDVLVANSELVAQRIQRYWGVPQDRIRIIYPPVKTGVPLQEGGDHYVTLSRLWPEKHVLYVAKLFADTGHTLKIGGDGPEAEAIRSVADDHANIEYHGYIPESQKGEFLADAKAFVFAAEGEDFGLAPAEAMAAGTPVIGVRDGFTEHQVLDGKNGRLFDRGELAAALDRFERQGVSWTSTQIAEFAETNFGRTRFEAQLKRVIREAEYGNRIRPDYQTPTSRGEGDSEGVVAGD